MNILVLKQSNVQGAATSASKVAEHVGFVHNEVTYGHLHYPKTAGSTINGELSSHFERVCGNKGYSYDQYQFNQRKEMNNTTTHVHKYMRNYEGGAKRVAMSEIGYEDCDYVSMEIGWRKWLDLPAAIMPLELHVPCRTPLVDHLMSQCNHCLLYTSDAADE